MGDPIGSVLPFSDPTSNLPYCLLTLNQAVDFNGNIPAVQQLNPGGVLPYNIWDLRSSQIPEVVTFHIQSVFTGNNCLHNSPISTFTIICKNSYTITPVSFIDQSQYVAHNGT